VKGASPRRVALASALTAAEAIPHLRGERAPFALVGDWLGEGEIAILGCDPVVVAPPDGDPFALLDRRPAVLPNAEVRVGGGWFGWLGYGLGARMESLPPPPPRPVPCPAFSLAQYDHVAIRDRDGWWFEALWTEPREEALHAALRRWRLRLQRAPQPPCTFPLRFRARPPGDAGHLAAVAAAHERIVRGDLLQANICLRLAARWAGDEFELFAAALPVARPRFGACFPGVVSLSPERFLRRQGTEVSSEPIKGTRPRACRPEELDTSLKDTAEHVMIVDLMRNDLGRVCGYGSVCAESPRTELHAGVWQRVSTVSGRLRPEVGDGALLRATFPPGSVTGAPKVMAMRVISELEACARELYTGAIGLASPLAGLDLSVAIRTFQCAGDEIWLGVGGGIVADSDPEAELEEAYAKAAGPVAALGGTILRARPTRRRGRPDRAALAHGPRPDPRLGVFETVLVTDGVAPWLPEHLARLTASLQTLYGEPLDPAIGDEAQAAAASGRGRMRLRIAVAPGGRWRVRLAPAEGSGICGPPAQGRAADRRAAHQPVERLTPFVLPGGLGAHKWQDRRLTEALGRLAPGTVPLFLDADGAVLEAGAMNVWTVRDGAWITPPADGRILPGVTRARLLAELPGAREAAFTLAQAGPLFLSSSIRGWRPARLA
jgi:para-aminobenzoate synthetase/4-amino-4-deoxychorismate lyase